MNTHHPRRFSLASPVLTTALAAFLAAGAGVIHYGGGVVPDSVVYAQAASETYKNVYDGWKWWHVYCYRCHGVDAVGTTQAPSLIDPNRKLSSAEFLKVVSNGVPDKGMQGWDKLLDPKQIGQIHLYVQARTDKVLPPGRPDEVGPNHGAWVPPDGWPRRR
jgi:mono/diheme cytochrome c family protein